MNEIFIEKDPDAVATHAADIFIETASTAITERGRFSASLSGGSTPKRLYQLLSSEQYRRSLDWTKAVFFIGDERNVPPDDEKSNLRMINETLIRPLGVETPKIYGWPVGIGKPEEVAQSYERELSEDFGTGQLSDVDRDETGATKPNSQTRRTDIPAFDLFLLGLGTDCHTASLFPNTFALEDTGHLTAANLVPQIDDVRFTLTFPVINAARTILFLVTGEEKAVAVSDVIECEFDPTNKPAQGVRPTNGRLIWLLDRPAASSLRKL